eukprot:SAG31_NODE_12887_length_909_cov_0.817284_2_plen_98_part_00
MDGLSAAHTCRRHRQREAECGGAAAERDGEAGEVLHPRWLEAHVRMQVGARSEGGDAVELRACARRHRVVAEEMIVRVLSQLSRVALGWWYSPYSSV